jgi:antitoxin ParD1/3/4
MAVHSLTFPPALQQWVEARIADGQYADTEDYLRDLVRRDREMAAEGRRLLKAMIEEGLKSGFADASPEAAIDRLIEEDDDLRG